MAGGSGPPPRLQACRLRLLRPIARVEAHNEKQGRRAVVPGAWPSLYAHADVAPFADVAPPQECATHHAAKEGDGWVEQELSFLFFIIPTVTSRNLPAPPFLCRCAYVAAAFGDRSNEEVCSQRGGWGSDATSPRLHLLGGEGV